MARLLNGTDQLLYRAGASGLSLPLTLAAWVLPQRNTAYEDPLCLARSADNSTGWFLQLRGPDGMRVAAVTASQNTFAIARSGNAYTLGTWHHVAGVFEHAASRLVYLDGVGGARETTNLNVSAVDRMLVGAWERLGGWIAYFAGAVAEAAVWQQALSAAEIAQLAAGYSPLLVRAESLVAYWPLGGPWGNDDLDHSGQGLDLTACGEPSWTTHPSITYPAPPPPQTPPGVYSRAGRIVLPGAAWGRCFPPGAEIGCVAGLVPAGRIWLV